MLELFSPLTARNFLSECPEVYDSFYRNHILVGSGNFSIPLNPILQSEELGANIVARQKVALQCLVGFSTSSSPSDESDSP